MRSNCSFVNRMISIPKLYISTNMILSLATIINHSFTLLQKISGIFGNSRKFSGSRSSGIPKFSGFRESRKFGIEIFGISGIPKFRDWDFRDSGFPNFGIARDSRTSGSRSPTLIQRKFLHYVSVSKSFTITFLLYSRNRCRLFPRPSRVGNVC